MLLFAASCWVSDIRDAGHMHKQCDVLDTHACPTTVTVTVERSLSVGTSCCELVSFSPPHVVCLCHTGTGSVSAM